MPFPVRALGPGLAALLAALPALAQQPDFELRRDLAAGRRFHLGNIVGDVRVTGGTGRTLEVTAVKRAGREGDPRDVRIETVELDDGIAVCVRYPGTGERPRPDRNSGGGEPCRTEGGSWDRNHRNDTEVNFTVRVPAGLQLSIATVSGDVQAERLEGNLELHSVSGDVELTGGRGPRIEVATVSGDLMLGDVTSGDVSAHTVSGEVRFQGPIEDHGSYEFESTSGDIALVLPRQPNAVLRAATFSGELSSDLPVEQPSNRSRRHRYDATWGSGSARLELGSLSGDISIRLAR